MQLNLWFMLEPPKLIIRYLHLILLHKFNNLLVGYKYIRTVDVVSTYPTFKSNSNYQYYNDKIDMITEKHHL